MSQLKMVKFGALQTSLNPWKAMPKANKAPADYTLKVNGKELKTPEVMLTGGGAHPAYTYINHDGQLFWFAGQFAAGTEVEVVEPKVEAPKPAEQPTPQPEAPKQEAPAQPAQKQGKKK